MIIQLYYKSSDQKSKIKIWQSQKCMCFLSTKMHFHSFFPPNNESCVLCIMCVLTIIWIFKPDTCNTSSPLQGKTGKRLTGLMQSSWPGPARRGGRPRRSFHQWQRCGRSLQAGGWGANTAILDHQQVWITSEGLTSCNKSPGLTSGRCCPCPGYTNSFSSHPEAWTCRHGSPLTR